MPKTAADYIRSHSDIRPKVAIVLGSGLGGFADQIEAPQEIAYTDIPGWPRSTAIGHAGRLVLGTFKGAPVAVMRGRAHVYEGHAPDKVAFGVRALIALGVDTFVFTNAAGGVRTDYAPGDLVLITDHINLMATSPLVGPNDDSLGPRFPDMSNAYDRDLNAIAREAATKLGQTLKEGVYAALLGPTYETPAEVRMVRTLGGDLVGMSTAPEVIAARHAGRKCLAISCVTNMAAGIVEGPIDGDHVIAAGAAAQGRLTALLGEIVPRLPR
jgi:purine-nucleoside phosphorylase